MQPGSWEVMGAEADGQRGQGIPLASPPLPWLMGEGPFVYQDKEEIEKFLRGWKGVGIDYHGDSLLWSHSPWLSGLLSHEGELGLGPAGRAERTSSRARLGRQSRGLQAPPAL